MNNIFTVKDITNDPVNDRLPHFLESLESYVIDIDVIAGRLYYFLMRLCDKNQILQNWQAREHIISIIKKHFPNYTHNVNFTFTGHNDITSDLFNVVKDFFVNLNIDDSDELREQFFLNILHSAPSLTIAYRNRIDRYLHENANHLPPNILFSIYWSTFYFIHCCIIANRHTSKELLIMSWFFFPSFTANILLAPTKSFFDVIDQKTSLEKFVEFNVDSSCMIYVFWLWSVVDYFRVLIQDNECYLRKTQQKTYKNKQFFNQNIFVHSFNSFLKCLRNGNVRQTLEHIFESYTSTSLSDGNPLIRSYLDECISRGDIHLLKVTDIEIQGQYFRIMFDENSTEFDSSTNTADKSANNVKVITIVAMKIYIQIALSWCQLSAKLENSDQKKKYKLLSKAFKDTLINSIDNTEFALNIISRQMSLGSVAGKPLSLANTVLILYSNISHIKELMATSIKLSHLRAEFQKVSN